MWRKFKRNRLAVVCGWMLLFMYTVILLSGFIAPYNPDSRFKNRAYVSPQGLHFFDDSGFHIRPFVYGLTANRDTASQRWVYSQDKTRRYPVKFFVYGQEYSFLGIKTNWHLFGLDQDGGKQQRGIFLFGTDIQGRDMFSRVLYGGRVSLTIGLFGVLLSVCFGSVLGVVAGYFGGIIDNLIQRVIEILRSFPRIPLWLALSAAIPPNMGQLQSYFMITIILSILGWTGMARSIRGQVLSLRNEEFVMSAKLMGASHSRVIFRHLMPAVSGYIIVVATIAVPGMILAESSLSFLGLGIRPPMVSWGALLTDCQSLTTLFYYQWLLLPALFIIIVVFCYNFLGDGLRDAVDPYSAAKR
ncbi:MAG: ABC transporter permease [Phycisphaerae bacterium]|nr:ABC transporter permease [Phycisphaerae bacterium]